MERYLDNFTNAHLSPVIIEALRDSFLYCEEIVKCSGTNFYFGMLLTPRPKRDAVYAIYAWMREIDDIADSNETVKKRQRKLIEYFKKTRELVNNKTIPEKTIDKHWLAFYKTVHDYNIPLKYFREMVLGQLQVVHHKTVQTFQDLYTYCYRVASTVGLILIHIWGYRGGKDTEKMAEYRGIAFQLINILRDIHSDNALGVVFLPEDIIGKTPINELIKSNPSKIEEVIHFLIDKIQDYFKLSSPLEKLIQNDGFISLRVMSEFYFSIFKKMRNQPDLILNKKKVRLNSIHKVYLIIKTYFLTKTTRFHYRYE